MSTQQPVFCNRCGQQNSAGRRQCWYCGTPIVYFCPNCHSAVYFGYAHCTRCGVPLYWGQQQAPPHATSTSWCPNCRSVIYVGAPICAHCGVRLDWSQWYSSTNAALCPRCCSVVYLGQNTCHNCGTWLDWDRYEKSAESTRTEPVKTAKVATAGAERPKDKSIASFISWLVAVPLILFIIFLVFVHLSPDYDMHMVTSESMVPAIKLGDLIITGPVHGTIRPGTVVTYKRGETLVTHRVISIKDGKLVTKGDAVEDPDAAPVALSQVKGVYLFKIPSLGYLANFMRTKLGWFIVVILPSIFLLFLIFYEIAKEVLKMPQRRPYTESYAQRR